jgi:eukaryotic-like serine/threonine-protein kinase
LLNAGSKLGPYEITGAIGAGGMGEVYQAHDTKLGRDVAIKILPEAFAHDPERLSRFQREAKMLAALNHPNIATIYGLEQSNGTHYLVMELVSGETLAERVKRDGAVPIEEALAICKQIAEALEAAHEKGIIHRDLKPANVKVTPEGKVKVLDFGLAKAFAGETNSDPSNSPTLSMAATMHGVILGTASYMSPEQARGKSVDKRTDIWAFGCVLYELLTGTQAFDGEDITEILAAIVKTEPDWQALPAETPVQIRTLLRRCLQKDKTLRLRDAGDARIEIQEALTAPAPAKPTISAARLVVGWRQAAVLGMAAVLIAVIAGLAVWNLMPTPAKVVTRTVINLPPGDQLAVPDYPEIALSPDGSQLAYVAIRGNSRQIYLRPMDGFDVRAVAGTEGAIAPFFSPDGQSLGFFAVGKLKRISVSGGAAQTLGDAAVPGGASWGNRGSIVFGNATGVPLREVPDTGGVPRGLSPLANGEGVHLLPDFLPDGETILFAVGNLNAPRIVAESVRTGKRRDLLSEAADPKYAASGHLLFVQGGTLMAVPFDASRASVTGAAVPMVENVVEVPFTLVAQYSVSAKGSLAYVPGGIQGGRRLVWVSRNGTEQPLAIPPHAYDSPRISPDGKRIAVSIGGQIWLCDLSRGTLTRFTFDGNANNRPVWTPDGKHIAFYSNKEGILNLFWQKADGSGGLEQLISSPTLQVPQSFSPDGQWLAFQNIDAATSTDIWVLRMRDRKAQPFLRTSFIEGNARFSPDGDWLAYVSDESGRSEVYVQSFPGPGAKRQISTEGGTEPAWNPNGKELFYRSGDAMMAVDVATKPTFVLGNPRMLFAGQYVPASVPITNYDVSPDGQKFLMVEPEQRAITQINIVQNWFEELKQKVPTGKK